MKRRTARQMQAQEAGSARARLIRVRVSDVYGGVFCDRDRRDETLIPLAASIARHGLLQPILVRPGGQRYALICGARRLAACRLIGLEEIDALCVDVGRHASAAIALEEHLTRRATDAWQEAQALGDAQEVAAEFALDGRELRRRQALRELPQDVQRAIHGGALSLDQSEPLLAVAGHAYQLEAARIIAERELSPGQARRLVHGPRMAR